jgi:hypothetical protein
MGKSATRVQNGHEIGREKIHEFLGCLSENVICEQLANLKASGNYDRIHEELCESTDLTKLRAVVIEPVGDSSEFAGGAA